MGVLCTQGHGGTGASQRPACPKGEAWWNANTGMSPLPQVGWGLPLGPAFDGVRRRLPCAPCPPRSCSWCGVKAGPGPFPTQFLGLLPLLYAGGGSPSVPSWPGARGPAQGGAHLPWMSGVLAQALVVGLQGGALGQRGAPDGQCQPVGTQRRAGALSLGPTGAGLRARLHRGEGEVVGGLDRGFWRGCGFWEPSQGVVSGLGQPGPVRGSLVETNDCSPQA